MKVVFVNLNSKYIHSSLAPWYLLASLKNDKSLEVEAEVIEGTINEPVSNIIERIEAAKPDILGFCCYIWNINSVLEIAQGISQKDENIKIIFGGPEVSYRAEDVLRRYSFVDAVLCGEGEWIVPSLIRAYVNNESISNIPGVCSRFSEVSCSDDEQRIIVNEPVVSCEVPPNPYSEEYFSSLKGRIAYFESSRGCPFSCAFCLSGRCGNVRYFPFEESARSLVRLAGSGTKTIKFVDRTFNAHHERTNRWLEFLLNERGKSIPGNVCFHFEIAGDLLKEDTLELLKSLPAGMVQLEIGLQSFNEDTLEAITRKTDTTRLKDNIKRLLAFKNMHIHLDLIMGLPFENMKKVRQSFNEAFALRPHMLQVGFLKLLHGAAMREESEKYPCVYGKEAPYEVISTPWLNAKELKDLHMLEDCVERIYNSGRLLRTMEYVLKNTDMDSFDFFMNVGMTMSEKILPGISLNDYERELFEVLSELEGVDRTVLRDMMVLDRLETDASGRIPDFLRIEDEKLRKAKKRLNLNEETRAIPGVKRGMAIIYSQKKVAYVDYIYKNPITGRYELKQSELF